MFSPMKLPHQSLMSLTYEYAYRGSNVGDLEARDL